MVVETDPRPRRSNNTFLMRDRMREGPKGGISFGLIAWLDPCSGITAVTMKKQ
jgi:hypothetical protein